MKPITAAVAVGLIIAVAGPAAAGPVSSLFADDFVYADHHVLDASTDLRNVILRTEQLTVLRNQRKVLFDLREIGIRTAAPKVRLERSGATLGEFLAKFLDERLYASQRRLWVRYVSCQRIAMFQVDDVPAALRSVVLEPGDCVIITIGGGLG